MTHETNRDLAFGSAFRRAATFWPGVKVTVAAGEKTLEAHGFCAVSFEPPVVALTFARETALTCEECSVATAAVKLDCRVMESKEVGDHWMVLAGVRGLEVRGGDPVIGWRRGWFRLRLDYPFLESAEALEGFVSGWRQGSLPKAAWTHAAHVAVTGYHAFDLDAETVFAEMRSGILHFNSCTGVVNGPDSGYHETLTRFWSAQISRFVREAAPASRLEAAVCAVGRFGEDRDQPSLFYSFDVVRDRRARAEWVAPDRAPRAEWCG